MSYPDTFNYHNGISRRNFLTRTGISLLSASAIGSYLYAAEPAEEYSLPYKLTPADLTPVPRKPLHAATEPQEGDYFTPVHPKKRIGFALVGLGNLTLGELMPAFGSCKYAKPVALVSGDAKKAARVAEQYGIDPKNIYNYKNFDRIRENKEIDAVYIVLPNSMHHEFTIRAAKAGKHVLCEKPMANSVKECEEMIAACKQAGKKLMVAYRIQYEPNNRMVKEWIRNKKYGNTKLIETINSQNIGDPGQWRLNKALSGGGALPDIGIYCLNTCRFLTGEEPEAVLASVYSTPNDERFREVEETVMFQLFFPSGIRANCTTSYGVHRARHYTVYGDKGAWFGMNPAFDYHGVQTEVARTEGKIEWKQQPRVSEKNQFALEMDHMALSILNDTQPYTPGEEGLQDCRIIEAIYASAREGKIVQLPRHTQKDVFRGTEPKDES
jgi:predicted dehydrogenase